MQSQEENKGLLFGVSAFILWGIAPIYFKLVSDVSAWQILAHRVVGSCLLLFLTMLLFRRKFETFKIFREKKLIFYLCLSTILIGFNWLLFTWAVINNFIMETSLGYFINPLVNMLLGLLIFRDQLSTAKYFALGLAFIGVFYQIIVAGTVPIIALALAFSFAFYGLIRKLLPVDTLNGQFTETLLLLPFGCLYLAFPIFDATPLQTIETFNYWLLLAGAVTTVPLALFASAASRLTLSTIGFIQFIAPSITFLLAVFVYHEPVTPAKIITFSFIWLGLIIYLIDGVYTRRRARAQSAAM